MWGGVTKGLAGINFSGSLRAPGKRRANLKRAAIRRTKPTASLVV